MIKSCLAFLFAWVAAAGALAFEAGVAKVDITPPPGVPLNGYGNRMGRPALKVHDPLWARCLYLNDGTTSLFLVTSDLCVINRELRERVLELAPSEVKPENIILTATHTHSGQGGMIRALIFRAVSGPFVPELLEKTARGFADAMRAAYDARRPAAIGYGTCEQHDLTNNRRYGDGPIDPQIGVIRVNDAEGHPLAILANLAAHPTTVSDDDLYLISADYPGFFYTTMEKLEGGDCVAMFMNGAEGNQRPTNPENHPESWKRTESIGRILAERAKAVADVAVCGDAKLHVGYATPNLPLSMASTLVYPSTFLYTLEINDLLLTFIPGESCVEVGLALRKRALNRGYKAQFTVSLANDYLAYFAPPEYYSRLHYESAMNFYGPGMLDWMGREFGALMTRPPAKDEPDVGNEEVTPAVPENVAGARRVLLRGTPYEIGFQRGAAFGKEITEKFAARIVAPVESGAWLPSANYWKLLGTWFNTTPLALFVLGIGARPLLEGVSADVWHEAMGVADGAHLPFDAVWLLQSATVLSAQPNMGVFYRAPFCTMLAAVSDRAGADDLLVGRNLDWDDPEDPVIVDTIPKTGHRFVQVGFTWNLGVFSGMNDAGLVLCAERMEPLGLPPIDGAPMEFVLRDVLQTVAEAGKAIEQLQGHPNLRGYQVLVAGPSDPGACVMEFGPSITVRKPVKGLLLGADPDSSSIDPAAKVRYARVAELTSDEHVISSAKIRSALADRPSGPGGASCIWNEKTKYSVVFEPKTRTLRAAFPDAHGAPGDYTTVSLKGKTP